MLMATLTGSSDALLSELFFDAVDGMIQTDLFGSIFKK
jgi:hypothetical protein